MTDFGISKEILPGYRLTGDRHGTLVYMAPEVQNKKKYNKSADFWAVGITALQIAGKSEALFSGSDDQEA